MRAAYAFLTWSWPYVFSILYFGTAIAASAHAVLFKRDVRGAVAWAGLIWLSPILGAALAPVVGRALGARAGWLLSAAFIPGLLLLASAPRKGIKVFISVDMEGVAGVVSGRECSASGPDYDYFRGLMSH